MKNQGGLVLFSGGLDSTTALYWARERFSPLFCLSFDYGQKHRIELRMAQWTADKIGIPITILILPLGNIVRSALTDAHRPIPGSQVEFADRSHPPPTYVPFRNGIFLSIGAAFSESRSIHNIITGFNTIDSPDYPDTTVNFTRRMESAINSGTGFSHVRPLRIHTPLISFSKADIIRMGRSLDADYSHTISCYRGKEIPCGNCPSCESRQAAFRSLKLEDPLLQRLKGEKKI